MKKLIPFLISLVFANPLCAQWVQQNSGTSTNLYDVYAITENTVIVVGANGTILKTTDGGENWNPVTSGTTYDLRKVQFVNTTTGYAVGFHGTLLKTTDTGATWTFIDTGTTEDLYGLSAVDENLLFISGTNGLLQKTIDGGTNWTTMATPLNQTVTDIQFFSDLYGFVQIGGIYEGNLYRTLDCGSNWTQITTNASAYFFLDENAGFILVSNEIYETSDGGTNINSLGFYSSPSVMSCVYSTNENILWAVPIDTAIGHPYHALKGDVAGQDINIILNEIDFPLESIHFFNESTGYTVGWMGAIYKNSTGLLLGVNEEINLNNIKIYPNPTSKKLNIKVSIHTFNLKIRDNLGKEVYKNEYNESDISMNVENFSKGVYFLTIETKNQVYTQKFIIN